MALNFPFTTSGGPDAVRLFGEIAGAAEAAQQKIDRANRRAEIGLKAVNSTMKEAKATAQTYASSLGPVGSVLGQLGSGSLAGAAVLGITAITGALLAGTKAAIDTASALKDNADKIGLNSETLQEYSFAAAQAGVDADKFQRGLGTLVRQLGQAQVGQGNLAKSLKDTDAAFLGQLKSAGSTEAALDLYIKRIANAGSVQEQARLAAAAFGRTLAVDLIPFFIQGADGIDKLRARAHELGIVISDDLVQPGEAAGDKLDELAAAIRGNLTTALLGLAPALGAAAEGLANFVASVGQAIDQTLGISLQGKIAKIQQQLAAIGPVEGLAAFSPAGVDKGQLERDLAELIRQRDEAKRQRDEAQGKTAQATRTLGAGEALEQAQAKRAKKSDDPAEKIAQLEQERRAEQEILRTAVREDAITIKAAKEERLRIDAFYADQEKQIRDKAAKEATDTAKREAKTLADIAKDVATAQDKAAASGLGEAEKVWKEAEQAIENFAEKVHENVKDSNEASRLIAEFRVATEKKASDDIAEIRDKENKKAIDEADKLWKAEQRIDEERIKDQDRAAKEAAKDAEQAAKEAAKDAEQAAKEAAQPFLDATENIGKSLTDALVDGFLSGEKQAKKTADVLKDLFRDLAKEVLGTIVQKSLVEPLQKQILEVFEQAAQPGKAPAAGAQGGGGFLSSIFGLFGGGSKSVAAGGAVIEAPTTQPMAGPLPEGVSESARPLVEATGGLTKSTAGLASTVAGLAAVVGALASAGEGMVEGRKAFDKASMGAAGSQAAKNAITGIQAALVVALTAAGAAAGAAFFGIGALPGAAIGALVGKEIGSAIEKAVVGGLKESVNKGLNQAQLDKKVAKKLADDLLLTIVFAGTNKSALGGLFGKLFSPDIENIFAKIFRQVLGGTGGFSTEGVAVKQRGVAGFGAQPQLVSTAQNLTQLIATSFGAGGQAFGSEREGFLTAILLGAVRKEVARSIRHGTPSPEDLELARAFAAAFQGNFYTALGIALKQGTGPADLVVRTFAKAQSVTPGTFRTLAGIVQEQGRVPLGQARKASREAFSGALEAAFKDAADSDAFRNALGSSVEEAFVKKAVTALDKSFGQLFAPFFALSKDTRREFQREKRRGDFPAALETLSDDFVKRADAFAKVVSDPLFVGAIEKLQDAFLKLQVEMALASGDINAAADAIEERLKPAIQLVKDVAQLQRDVRSRTALALAGPGFGAQEAQVEELRRRREEVEAGFSSRFGGAKLPDFGRLLRGEFPKDFSAARDQGLVAADRALQQTPRKVLDAFRDFADARLNELEAELSLAREMETYFKGIQKTFRGISKEAQAGQGKGTTAAGFQDIIDQAARDAYVAFASALEDPDAVSALQDSLTAAISEAASRVQVFEAFAEQFKGFRRAIDQTLGRGDDRSRIKELMASLNSIADPTDPEQMAQAAADMGEAIQLATTRFEAFTAAAKGFADVVEGIDVTLGTVDQRTLLQRRRKEINDLLTKALGGDLQATQDIKQPLDQAVALATSRREQFKAAAAEFGDFADQAMVARRGRRGQRTLLASKRGEIAQLLGVAHGGGEGADDAVTQLRKLLPETLALGQQTLSGGRLRRLAAELEAAGIDLQSVSEKQVSLAEDQLKELRAIAAALGTSSTGQATDAKRILDDLFTKAGGLGTVAEDQKTIALGQLVTLGRIADAVAGSAGESAAAAAARAASVKGQLEQFRKDIQPVLDYLAGQAGDTLNKDLQDVIDALGNGSDMVLAINEVRDRLPVAAKAAGGPVASGRSYWVGEQGPEIVVPQQAGTVLTNRQSTSGPSQSVTIHAPLTLQISVPEQMTRAEADDLARTLTVPLERQMQRAAQRVVQQLRKVA